VVEIHRALGGGWEVCEGVGSPNCTGGRTFGQ
jgi:multidrug efflux system outer membrane protein